MTAAADNPTLTEFNTALPLRKIDALIERMDITADAKALLRDLGRISITIGGTLVHIGRKILTLAVEICKRFPNTLFGIVATVAVSMALPLIPLTALRSRLRAQ